MKEKMEALRRKVTSVGRSSNERSLRSFLQCIDENKVATVV